ncbi:hemerythrin domain-containing protein [Paenibacillus sp. CAU 1782]
MSETDQLRFSTPAMRILENEHRYLSYLMDEWHAIVRYLENESYPVEEGRRLLHELRKQLEEFKPTLAKHTAKEEAYFFPLLGSYIGFEQGPLVGIQEEHKEIDAYIGHFMHHTETGVDQLSLDEIRAVSRDAGEAFEVLTVHFVKEETVLFPMAEGQIGPGARKRLDQQLNTLIS